MGLARVRAGVGHRPRGLTLVQRWVVIAITPRRWHGDWVKTQFLAGRPRPVSNAVRTKCWRSLSTPSSRELVEEIPEPFWSDRSPAGRSAVKCRGSRQASGDGGGR
jgi:2-polyprenyl-6-methoxyphenol hydroxylase-like FAD-dependent oxidoreductase